VRRNATRPVLQAIPLLNTSGGEPAADKTAVCRGRFTPLPDRTPAFRLPGSHPRQPLRLQPTRDRRERTAGDREPGLSRNLPSPPAAGETSPFPASAYRARNHPGPATGSRERCARTWPAKWATSFCAARTASMPISSSWSYRARFDHAA